MRKIREGLLKSINLFNSGQWKSSTNFGLEAVSESDFVKNFDLEEGKRE